LSLTTPEITGQLSPILSLRDEFPLLRRISDQTTVQVTTVSAYGLVMFALAAPIVQLRLHPLKVEQLVVQRQGLGLVRSRGQPVPMTMQVISSSTRKQQRMPVRYFSHPTAAFTVIQTSALTVRIQTGNNRMLLHTRPGSMGWVEPIRQETLQRIYILVFRIMASLPLLMLEQRHLHGIKTFAVMVSTSQLILRV
jgi:hypothetical protein